MLWKAYHDFDNEIVEVVAVVANAVALHDDQLRMNYYSTTDDDAVTKN